MSSAVQDIISAMEFAASRGLRKFAHSDGKTQITLWRGVVDGTQRTAVQPVPTSPPEKPSTAGSAATIMVTAPLSGICHLSPDPSSPVFVSMGSQIGAGQTLCIVEAMKMMTAVTAPQSGKIVKVHCRNGVSVQAGDPLVEVAP